MGDSGGGRPTQKRRLRRAQTNLNVCQSSLDNRLCVSNSNLGAESDHLFSHLSSFHPSSEAEEKKEDTVVTAAIRKVKVSLAYELSRLSSFGWYWGPMSKEEADEKLDGQPDGSFLVRDSSAERYLLSLSFRCSGKTFHARIEHNEGLFSFFHQSGFSFIADLIDSSLYFSSTSVLCYSQPVAPGDPTFPVRLTKPISRFTQIRSLQYLCRFVIRQNMRFDYIQSLPIPVTLKRYLEENHY